VAILVRPLTLPDGFNRISRKFIAARSLISLASSRTVCRPSFSLISYAFSALCFFHPPVAATVPLISQR
jgi:hypothetical protein